MTNAQTIRLPYTFARQHGIAVDSTDASHRILMHENAAVSMLPEVLRVVGGTMPLKSVTLGDFDKALSAIYAAGDIMEELEDTDMVDASLEDAVASIEGTSDLLASDDDAPVIRLINSVMAEAVKSGASDVHLEPYKTKLAVRLRLDGVLSEVAHLPAGMATYIVSRIKVMARMDIAEKRVPQDGRLSLTLGGQSVDVRVSTLPARFGERVVLRLLDNAQARLSLTDLGMPADTLARFRDGLNAPNGIILVTGPTGSGKTTTLYAGLALLNDQSRNIMTVEDPIEYALDGVSQTQVNDKVGLTFAGGLRAILRQDPDVIMVGEVRDTETAEMAVQASLTGHLVLSTVHTNSAAAAVTRLLDMGVESFLLASTVKGILAQRLVRKLCPECKTPMADTTLVENAIGEPVPAGSMLFEAKGCSHCKGTGYKGRVGIYELIQIDETLQQMIQSGASEQAMEAHAFASHDRLSDCAKMRLLAGETTLGEILRVTSLKAEHDSAPSQDAGV